MHGKSQVVYTGILSAALLLAVGCGSPGTDAGTDAASSDAGIDSGPSDAGPQWEPGLLSTDKLPPIRGMRLARGIIHLHTVYSHDACDGMPEIDGMPNEPCNQDLRYGLCTTKMDYALQTDHDDLLGFTPFDEAVLTRPGDEPIVDPVTGALVANRIVCADGHRVLTMVGSEQTFMPVGFNHHPNNLPPGMALHDTYGNSDPAVIADFVAAGAVPLVAHTEERDVPTLLAANTAGFEIYNLHAQLDPESREMYLGLPALSYINDLAVYNDGGGVPDLAFLVFYTPNDNALEKWNEVLGTRPAVGTLGTDAHQNVFPIPFTDGERLDSYRRMFRWFSNWLLVADVDPDNIRGALSSGRLVGVMEILGTPTGFDFFAAPGGDPAMAVEMGGNVSLAAAPTLEVSAPAVLDRLPSQPEPEVIVRLLRVVGSTTEIVAEGGPGEDVSFTPTVPGVYRVEVSIVPLHWTGFLGADPTPYLVPYTWIYANPIYVDP